VSELLWAFAGDFIRVGDSVEQRKNRLVGACCAWNMACNPARLEVALAAFMQEYQRCNSRTDPADLRVVRKDMEMLIQRKMQMFPSDRRQIVSARLVRVGDCDRIEAMSATLS
jgi:hypothetical protein